MREERLTPQPTLRGYNAWVVKKLMAARGDGPGPTAAWIIDRWITENKEALARDYDIRNEDFRSARVIDHPSTKKAQR